MPGTRQIEEKRLVFDREVEVVTSGGGKVGREGVKELRIAGRRAWDFFLALKFVCKQGEAKNKPGGV